MWDDQSRVFPYEAVAKGHITQGVTPTLWRRRPLQRSTLCQTSVPISRDFVSLRPSDSVLLASKPCLGFPFPAGLSRGVIRSMPRNDSAVMMLQSDECASFALGCSLSFFSLSFFDFLSFSLVFFFFLHLPSIPHLDASMERAYGVR